MAKYTTQTRRIVENLSIGMEGASISKRIDEANKKIFEYYPLFDENHREELNRKIIMHYYTREICAETVGLWMLWLNERMNLIMPEFNQLYESAALEYDILSDTDLTDDYDENENADNRETSKNDRNGTFSAQTGTMFKASRNSDDGYKVNGKTEVSETGKTTDKGTVDMQDKELSSDLPQANAAGVDYGTEHVLKTQNSGTTNQNDRTLKGTTTQTNNDSHTYHYTSEDKTDVTDRNNTTDVMIGDKNERRLRDRKYQLKRKGKSGGYSYAKLIMEYRQAVINVDRMIIEELKDLFMGVW